jgi:hypothetical protein
LPRICAALDFRHSPPHTCAAASGSTEYRYARSASSGGNHGLSSAETFFTHAFGGGFTTKRTYVGSSSRSGLKFTQISEPVFRIVGMRTSHDVLLTRSASSTHAMSMPSSDLIFVTL